MAVLLRNGVRCRYSRASLLACAVLVLTGCGGSSVSDGPAEDDASDGSEAKSDAGTMPPERGACTVKQRLGPALTRLRLRALPTRVSDAFVFLEDSPQPEFVSLVGTDSNEWREVTIGAAFFPYLRPVAAGSARAPQWLLFDRLTPQGFDGQFLAQAVRADGTAIAPLAPVLSIFDRGTAAYPTTTALDGERVAVGNGHIATRDPHFVLLDKDARRVGDELRLLDSVGAPSFTCFALTGTAHGVLASVVDRLTQQLHVLELDASGSRVNEATWPTAADDRCPWVSVDPTGSYLSFGSGVGTHDETPLSVLKLANNSLTVVASLPAPPEHVQYRWVTGGEEPLVAVNDNTDPGGRRVSFAHLRDGALLPLSGAPFLGELVPSADGRVFVASFEASDAGSAALFEQLVTIVEVACGGASP